MSNKQCIIYFLVLLFVNISISLQPGPVPFSARRTDLIESQSCQRSGWSCKDCSTLQSCSSENIFKFQISCGDQFPDRPYCDPSSGRCVSDRHVCSEMKDPEFICPGVGIYPDLTDCRRYISCKAKGEVGLIYSCLFQSVYNPIAKRCITRSYCYDPMVDCNVEYKTMAYNPDPSLYIVCRGDQKPLIKDCGSKMLEYDPSLLACDFKCKEEGRFPHPTNKTLFYICVYNDNEIVRMMGLCREGTIYDEYYDTCVYDFELTTTTQLIEVTSTEEDILETTTEEKILETTTEEQILETITENVSETTTYNNDQNLETTAVNEEQQSEAITENIEVTTSQIALNETTTANENEDETTIKHQDLQTTIEDVFPSVTIDNGQETSTVRVIEEKSTTENIITEEENTTTNGLEESDTAFTTDNTEGDLTTTSINLENITNFSEESLETTEKNDTVELDNTNENITNSSEESLETTGKNDTVDLDNTNENITNSSEESLETTEKNDTAELNLTNEDKTDEETEETTENTKEDLKESDEQTEETKEIQSNEDEDSNQSVQKSKETDESNNDSEETNETKEKTNELKDKKRKCIGRICIPNWKLPGFLKKNKSN